MFQEDTNKVNTQAAAEANPLLVSAQVDVAGLTRSIRDLDLSSFKTKFSEIGASIINPIEILKRTEFLDEEATKIRNSLD